MKYDKSNFRQDDIENCDKLAQLLHNLVISNPELIINVFFNSIFGVVFVV